jgi:hypothetical protein
VTLWTVLCLDDAGIPAGTEQDRVSIVLDTDRGRAEREADELTASCGSRFRVYAVTLADGGYQVQR